MDDPDPNHGGGCRQTRLADLDRMNGAFLEVPLHGDAGSASDPE